MDSNIHVFRKIALVLVSLLTTSAVFAGSQSAGNRMVMVTNWGADEVALVDLKGEKDSEVVWALNTYEQDGCSKPYDVKVHRDKAMAYVSCSGSDEIAAIDVVAQLVHHKIKTGSSPRDIALTSDGKRAVVANAGSDTVSVVDLEKGKVLYDIEVGVQPYGVSLLKGDSMALVTGWASGDAHFIKLGKRQGKVVKSIPVGMLPYTVVSADDSDIAYVSVNANHELVAIDVNKMEIVDPIRVGKNPWGVGMSPDGSVLVVANNRSSDISILRGTGKAGDVVTEMSRINLGSAGRSNDNDRPATAPKNTVVSDKADFAVVSDLANNDILVVNIDSGAVERVIPVGKAPYGLDFLN